MTHFHIKSCHLNHEDTGEPFMWIYRGHRVSFLKSSLKMCCFHFHLSTEDFKGATSWLVGRMWMIFSSLRPGGLLECTILKNMIDQQLLKTTVVPTAMPFFFWVSLLNAVVASACEIQGRIESNMKNGYNSSPLVLVRVNSCKLLPSHSGVREPPKDCSLNDHQPCLFCYPGTKLHEEAIGLEKRMQM